MDTNLLVDHTPALTNASLTRYFCPQPSQLILGEPEELWGALPVHTHPPLSPQLGKELSFVPKPLGQVLALFLSTLHSNRFLYTPVSHNPGNSTGRGCSYFLPSVQRQHRVGAW